VAGFVMKFSGFSFFLLCEMERRWKRDDKTMRSRVETVEIEMSCGCGMTRGLGIMIDVLWCHVESKNKFNSFKEECEEIRY
jgi:hypothetical protein